MEWLVKYSLLCLVVLFLVGLLSPILVVIWGIRLFNHNILPELAYSKVWGFEALGGKE